MGTYFYVTGSIYEGEWFEDKVNGYGVLIVKDNYRYEG
jgi:hypothetical protein